MLMQIARASRHPCIVALAVLGLVAAIAVLLAATQLNMRWGAALMPAAELPRSLVLSLIIFGAAIVSSIVGFAFSAIASALILHYVPAGIEAVQIMMIATIGSQAYGIAGLARSIQWSRCVPFVAGGLIALPFGIGLLLTLEPKAYILTMGVALIAYGLYMLLKRPALVKSGRRPWADALAGALGGITGPVAAFPGAFVTIWCAMRGWTKIEQRATYQPYILIMQLAGFGMLFLLQPRGAFDPALLGYALPGLAGAVIGLRVFHTLTDSQFQRMINLALVTSGIALLFK